MTKEENRTTNYKMDLEKVRLLAKEEGYEEICFNEKLKVISFLPHHMHSSHHQDDYQIRINVYWVTGTVSTSLNQMRRDMTQLFRGHVNMVELRSIFRNPRLQCNRCRRVLAPLSQPSDQYPLLEFKVNNKGVKVDGYKSSPSSSSSLYDPIEMECSNRRFCQKILTEESEVKAQLEWLEKEISFLQEQKDQVKAIAANFEEERRKKAAAEEAAKRKQEEKLRLEKLQEERHLKDLAEAAERERMQKIRLDTIEKIVEIEGKNEMVFRRLILAAVETVDKEFQESRQREEEEERRLERESRLDRRGKYMACCIDESDFVSKKFNETVSCIAIGGNATMMLYENGSWTCTAGIPKLLYNELNGREVMALPPPTYVALGSFDRYYIQFEDGNNLWVGCDEMAEALQHETRKVKSVAFGKYWDSYFIVFDDGYWICNNIPNSLCDLVRRNKCCDNLRCVSLGPNGEYYVSANNGHSWWGGSAKDQMNAINKYRDRIEFIDFGDNYTHILRYT